MSSSKVKDIKKAQYYVCYLGWHECSGLFGKQFVMPVLGGLIEKWRNNRGIPLTKITIQVSKKDIKIVQEANPGKKKTDKVKYPPIPSKDVTFACQGQAPDHDTVGVIFLGYNPQTHNAVHVHGYRCDSPETASILAGHLNQLANIPEHRERLVRVEQDLVEQGQILPRSRSFPPNRGDRAGSFGGSSGSTGSGSDAKEVPSPTAKAANYDSIQTELREKLKIRDGAPILLPPVDYDTISRSHGDIRKKRKSLQFNSMAPTGAFIRKIDIDDTHVTGSSEYISKIDSDSRNANEALHSSNPNIHGRGTPVRDFSQSLDGRHLHPHRLPSDDGYVSHDGGGSLNCSLQEEKMRKGLRSPGARPNSEYPQQSPRMHNLRQNQVGRSQSFQVRSRRD